VASRGRLIARNRAGENFHPIEQAAGGDGLTRRSSSGARRSRTCIASFRDGVRDLCGDAR